MSIWKSSTRLFTSSQCFHVTRTLVGECSSSGAARYLRSRQHNLLYSTNAADNAAPSQSLPASLPRSSSDESQPGSSISAPSKPQYDPSDNKLGHETEKLETFADHLVGLLKKKERERKRRRKPHRAPTKKNDIKVSEKKPQQPLESSDGLTKVLHSSTTSTPTFDCYIVRESWKGEPWSITENPTTVNQPPDVLRSTPPHTSPKEVSQEGSIGPSNESVLIDVAPKSEHLPVATLAHGLDRILFNPGVHWLRDPRSHVYNFTPWLERIPKVNDFAFERLTGFIKSSRDEDLRALARQEDKLFAGSTSSLSGMLSHIYFLLSEYKEVDCTVLSQHFRNESTGFTAGQRMPAMVMLNYKDGIYAIDSHSAEWDDPDKNVLTWMGTLLENFLTKPPEEFKNFMRIESEPIQPGEKPMREAFRFAKSDKFVMRSQLDCQDDRLPGTGVFDIKTRACVSIRMDILNYEENSGYFIRSQYGIFESFEREYYDLIRSAFLKYTFQVRIGNMDGVMVAYHNTDRIFGFQYISRDEMDERLFGSTPGIGDKIFNHSIKLLEAILEEAAKCYPEQSVICGFETRLPGKVLDVFVQPADWIGDEDQRPIMKLAVTLDHELNGTVVRASTALKSTNEEWKINYQIYRVKLSEDEIRSDYKMFLQHKKRTLVLPSDIPLEKAEEFWASLNFGNKLPEGQAKLFRPEAFSLATSSVEKYRELAREGRLFSSQLEASLAGRAKVVLGRGVYEEEPLALDGVSAPLSENVPLSTPEPSPSEPPVIDLDAVAGGQYVKDEVKKLSD